jgi:hypothetical protein
MAYTRQWLSETLRRLGYTQAAEDVSRELPDEFDLEQLTEFGRRHGISRGQLIEQMGGSP